MSFTNKTIAIFLPFEMELQVIFFGFFLLLVNGARIRRDAEDDCDLPPENTERVNCCEMPRRHLWGEIRETFHVCAETLREKYGDSVPPPPPPPPFQEGEGFPRPPPPPPPFQEGEGFPRPPPPRHFFRQKFHDGCFMECIFEREGLLSDNTVNKEALNERIETSMEGYDDWKATAEAAVEKCVTSDIEIPANETCRSGSAEVGKCIMKEMFMECPTWLQGNEYCTSLREFYLRCPDGPPPEFFPRHRMHHGRNRRRPIESEPGPEHLEGQIEQEETNTKE